MKCRVAYDKSAIEPAGRIDDIELGMRHGEQARIDGHVPMELAVAGDRLAIIPLMRPGDPASYFIHLSPLLDA